MSLKEGRTKSRIGGLSLFLGERQRGLGQVLWFSNSGRTQRLLGTPRSWEQESVKYRGAGREDLYRKLGVALYDTP